MRRARKSAESNGAQKVIARKKRHAAPSRARREGVGPPTPSAKRFLLFFPLSDQHDNDDRNGDRRDAAADDARDLAACQPAALCGRFGVQPTGSSPSVVCSADAFLNVSVAFPFSNAAVSSTGEERAPVPP